MFYHTLAVDYDGTIAHDGHVDEATIDALQRLRDSGRHLVLVTGRRLEPLQEIFPRLGLFDRIVAENGALVFDPETGDERLLCPAVPMEFMQRLKDRGVNRIEHGRAIVATWQPHEVAALQVIHEMNLELQIIFNKDAVMILPTGINKAAGLKEALCDIGLTLLNTVAVGDAENDLIMLGGCGASAAVDNALDSVKQAVDIVLGAPRGAGVQQLIGMIVDNDLSHLRQRPKHAVKLGFDLEGKPFTIPFYGESVLVTGGPGGGKSKFATSFLEQLTEMGAQCVILDPEGDYQQIHGSIVLGTSDRAPEIEEVLKVLEKPEGHCIVSFFSVKEKDRPVYFDKLYRALAGLRSRTGRPHWIVVDEAHYATPREWKPAEAWHPDELKGVMFITAFHREMSQSVLESLDMIISIAKDPRQALEQCCELLGEPTPDVPTPEDNQVHHALAWHRGTREPTWFSRMVPKAEHQRHIHSHFDGEMDEAYRFIFRGPEGKVQLPAQNLKIFIQLAQGIDDETWE
ncbi:MAG: HAD-IIB family hydrolase, partial [Aureliella sp.]